MQRLPEDRQQRRPPFDRGFRTADEERIDASRETAAGPTVDIWITVSSAVRFQTTAT